jgi:hypothetical protein
MVRTRTGIDTPPLIFQVGNNIHCFGDAVQFFSERRSSHRIDTLKVSYVDGKYILLLKYMSF